VSIRNICLDLLRERERRRQDELPHSLPAASTEDEELQQMVGKLIAALPEREREVIHLHDCEGLGYDEIAEIIGSSESAARMACSRARQKIKEELIKIINNGV
jgi:RNA polymerase sigma-70 factor (ECF subfamily)